MFYQQHDFIRQNAYPYSKAAYLTIYVQTNCIANYCNNPTIRIVFNFLMNFLICHIAQFKRDKYLNGFDEAITEA